MLSCHEDEEDRSQMLAVQTPRGKASEYVKSSCGVEVEG